MRLYKITYIRNEASICRDVTGSIEVNGIYHYEHKNGNLIYAIIKAENEENAVTIANFISAEVKEKFRVKDAN